MKKNPRVKIPGPLITAGKTAAFFAPFPISTALSVAEYIYTKKLQYDVLDQIKRDWFPRGIFVFFLYSDERIWKGYFEKELIPRIQDHAVVWDWTTRIEDGWNDDLIEAKVLKLFKGPGSSYPIAFIVSPDGTVEKFRFRNSFTAYKKSGDPTYKKLERRFLSRVKKVEEEFV